MSEPELSINEDWFHQYYFHAANLFGIPCLGNRYDGRLDADGIPIVDYKWEGRQYNPAYVAWWGLGNLPFRTDVLGLAADWLEANAVRRWDGGRVWEYAFNWVEGRAYLKAPWISAMAQGLAISALVRSWRLFGNSDHLDMAVKASSVFWVDIENSGVRDRSEGLMFLEEYPARPYPRILDGFCFALLALNDLCQTLGEGAPHKQLLDQGLDTLEAYLPRWSFLNAWSWYGRQGFLCSDEYHTLNCVMLDLLHRISGRARIGFYHDKWSRTDLPFWQNKIIHLFKKYALAIRRRQYNQIRRRYIQSGVYRISSSAPSRRVDPGLHDENGTVS